MKNLISIKTVRNIIIIIDSLVPLLVIAKGSDYFYYPKIAAIYILLTAALVVSFVSYRKKTLKPKISGELIPVLFFLIMVVLSTACSPYKSQAIWGRPLRWEGMMAYISYFVILYLSFICAEDDNCIFRILTYIIISGCIISIIGILQYLGLDIIPKDSIRKEWVYTSFSTLGNPNFVGSFLSCIFPISFFIYLSSKKTAHEKLLFAANIILFSALICTRTRSAWLGTSVSVLFIIILSIKKITLQRARKTAVLISGMIMAAFLLNNVHGGIIYSKFKSMITDYKTVVNNDGGKEEKLIAGSQRIFIWSRTMDYIFDRPFLGSGPDTFDKVFKMSREEASYHFGSPAIFVDKAHNEYLQIAVTLGFPALIFYVSFLFMIIIKSVKIILCCKNNTITLCIFAGFLAYIIQAFFNISVVSVAPVYWSVTGLLIMSNKRQIATK